MSANEWWEDRAKALLKSELKRGGVSYRELAARMTAAGAPETEASVRNKIARGRFSAVFMLMALDAAGCKSLHL